jgi:hypothetical protein
MMINERDIVVVDWFPVGLAAPVAVPIQVAQRAQQKLYHAGRSTDFHPRDAGGTR